MRELQSAIGAEMTLLRLEFDDVRSYQCYLLSVIQKCSLSNVKRIINNNNNYITHR